MNARDKKELLRNSVDAPADAVVQVAAYGTATRILSRRGHSRSELISKLRQRGYDDAVIDTVLARCERHNYINDTATCEHFSRELIRKGQGPRAIQQRLTQRGFDRGLVEATLADHYPAPLIHETARAVATRKAMQLKTRCKEGTDIRSRLFRFLTQRGFPAEAVHDAIAHVVNT